MKFNWITLHVKDLDRSAAFYGDYLGMKLAREFAQPGGRHFKFYEAANGMQVELIGGGGETVSASNLSLGVAVSDYDKQIHEEFLRVNRLLDTLPREQSEIVRLNCYDDLTFKQIAELQDIPEATAKSRYRYAIMHVQQMMKKGEKR